MDFHTRPAHYLWGNKAYHWGESFGSLFFLSIKSLDTNRNHGKCHELILNSVIEVRLKTGKLLGTLPRIPLKKKNDASLQRFNKRIGMNHTDKEVDSETWREWKNKVMC